ncbi:MAG: hypothetical protein QXQ61_03520 [Candidatus Bathyarchaeia archaeon]
MLILMVADFRGDFLNCIETLMNLNIFTAYRDPLRYTLEEFEGMMDERLLRFGDLGKG